MILGIGTDIVDISRISGAGESFVKRVYADSELAGVSGAPLRRGEQLAGMFAAKEAVVKALGCGFGRVMPAEVCITRDGKGQPHVMLTGEAKAVADAMGVSIIHVSISHCADYAVGFAVAESLAD